MTHEFICDCCSQQPANEDFFLGVLETQQCKPINEASANQVTDYVVKNFTDLLESNEFQKVQCQAEMRTPVPQIRHSQVELGDLLGEGAFSDVFEVKRFHPSLSSTFSADENGNNDEQDEDMICRIQADRVAVKVLRRKVTVRPGLFASCAAGLAKEGAILGSLSHKNIIQMKAFSQGGLSAYATGRSDAFFIVLDRLHEILDSRITRWAEQEKQLKHCILHRRQKQQDFFRERLTVSADLADALAYLHKNNIIHRDIKPSNVGFDAEGTLKLFDFDISRVLPKETYDDELFHLSVATGTQRYMSPECALTGLYNLKSDVYSFAILFHQVLSMELPFAGVSKSEHDELVFRWGERPKLHDSWPVEINDLLKEAWSEDIPSRPTMSNVHERIVQTIGKLDGTPSPNGVDNATAKRKRLNLGSLKLAASIRRNKNAQKCQ